MTVAMRAIHAPSVPTALRVAVVHDGRVLEERLFREPCAIRIGTNEKATFTLPPGGPQAASSRVASRVQHFDFKQHLRAPRRAEPTTRGFDAKKPAISSDREAGTNFSAAVLACADP